MITLQLNRPIRLAVFDIFDGRHVEMKKFSTSNQKSRFCFSAEKVGFHSDSRFWLVHQPYFEDVITNENQNENLPKQDITRKLEAYNIRYSTKVLDFWKVKLGQIEVNQGQMRSNDVIFTWIRLI